VLVYQINAVSKLHWVCWDGEFVIFDETSGLTNCMQASAGLVLDLLCNSALSISELSGEIYAIPDIDPSLGEELFLENILNELKAIGLVDVAVR